MSHQWIVLLVVADLILSALVVFYRGAVRQSRKYDMWDGILGLLETALIIWGVLSL